MSALKHAPRPEAARWAVRSVDSMRHGGAAAIQRDASKPAVTECSTCKGTATSTWDAPQSVAPGERGVVVDARPLGHDVGRAEDIGEAVRAIEPHGHVQRRRRRCRGRGSNRAASRSDAITRRCTQQVVGALLSVLQGISSSKITVLRSGQRTGRRFVVEACGAARSDMPDCPDRAVPQSQPFDDACGRPSSSTSSSPTPPSPSPSTCSSSSTTLGRRRLRRRRSATRRAASARRTRATSRASTSTGRSENAYCLENEKPRLEH